MALGRFPRVLAAAALVIWGKAMPASGAPADPPLALPREVRIRNTTAEAWALTIHASAAPIQVEIAGLGGAGPVTVTASPGAEPIRLGPGASARLLPGDPAVAPRTDFTLTRSEGTCGQAFRWGFPRDWAVAPVHWQASGPEPMPVSFRLHYPTAYITLIP